MGKKPKCICIKEFYVIICLKKIHPYKKKYIHSVRSLLSNPYYAPELILLNIFTAQFYIFMETILNMTSKHATTSDSENKYQYDNRNLHGNVPTHGLYSRRQYICGCGRRNKSARIPVVYHLRYGNNKILMSTCMNLNQHEVY